MLSSFSAFAALLAFVVGQSPPSQPSASQPATSQPAAGQHAPPPKSRLAVLDFKVAGKVDPTGSGVIADAVRDEFHRCGQYDLMDRQMMRERMGEVDWAATADCDQGICLVKYGKSLEVQKIVGGQVASFGETWVITVRLVDVTTGREEKLFTKKHDGKMSDLIDLARDGAREIIGLSARLPPPPVKSEPPPDNKKLTLDCGNGVTMELVLIPTGTFTMGSNDGASDEKPPHQVTISKPFYLGKYEVTQAQWQAVMGSSPSHFKGDSNLPVESVSWDDCQEFCKKLSAKTGKAVRLPTEAEWEYACRAGSTGKFCFGDTDSGLDAYAWYTSNSGSKTHPVGQKTANAWGLHDMHGNVWEWCADWYDKYTGSSATSDSFGQKCRVLRGGCWNSSPDYCRSADRGWTGPDYRYCSYGLGLRVALGTQ